MTSPEVTPSVLNALRAADQPAAGPQPGELWRARDADGHTAALVLVRAVEGDGLVVVPVTFDVDHADERTLLVPAESSPLGIALAVHDALEHTVDLSTAIDRLGSIDAGGADRGTPVVSPLDERAEFHASIASVAGGDDDGDWWPLAGEATPLAELLTAVHAELADTHPAARVVPRPDALALVNEMDAFVLVVGGDVSLDGARQLLQGDPSLSAVCFVAPADPSAAVIVDRRDVVDAIETPSGELRPPRQSRPPAPIGEALVKFLDNAISPFGRLAATVVDSQGVDPRELAVDAAAEAVRAVEASAKGFKVEGKRPGYERVTRHKAEIIGLIEAALADPSVDVAAFFEGDE
jgi:hypothetical protein